MKLQDVLVQILTKKYISLSRGNASRTASRSLPVKLKVKIVEARGLTTKDKCLRDPVCQIQVGNIDRSKDKDAVETFSTDIIRGNNNPYWNQHVNLKIRTLDDKINLEIWDDNKGHFLGRVLLTAATILDSLDSDRRISGWYQLEKHPKQKSKYVGGEMYLDICSEHYVFFIL
jgi:Ca2+-dependent lipid-binding protein